MKFNDSQKEAICFQKGPCLTLAGPGSGKTAVLTHRVQHLIEYGKVNPSEILVVTFTKAAATEMKQRFLKLMGEKTTTVTFGTFHAVFFMILKYAYHYQADNIIREEQKFGLVRNLIHKYHLEYEDEKECIGNILSEISNVKNSNVELEHYYAKNCGENEFRKIYRDYQNTLYKYHMLDFDDMLVYTYELFRERKDILALWQKKYRYILIDEFQDINALQYAIVRMLAEPENNLFIVGDDDQSIYRFRQAKPEIMLHFQDDYPDAKKILLNVNYRSDGAIVEAAGRLIANNKIRYPKEIQAFHKAKNPPIIQKFPDNRKENEAMIHALQEYRAAGGALRDVAVLYRTNTQAGLLMQQLGEYNIPFWTKERVPNIYDHWIVKDLETYMRIAAGSRKRADFLQIMNRPNRYIGRDSLDEETVAFDVWAGFYELLEQPWIARRIDQLAYDVKMLANMKPFAAINYIRKGIGYEEFLKEYARKRGISEEELLDVLEEITGMAKDFSSFEEWQKQKETYLLRLEHAAQQERAEENQLLLMTLHGSKGLEYDVVFIPDVNEGIMPYKKAVLPDEVEEERRMFYVGMTRAKKQLYLFYVEKHHNHSMDPSRFLQELG